MNAHDPARASARRRRCDSRGSSCPIDSGPKISVIRPRGMPPTPSARSSATEPVGYDVDVLVRALVAETHDRATAELLLDLENGGVNRPAALAGACGRALGLGLGHRGFHLSRSPSCYRTRRRIRSLLVDGFAARLALWFDHLDRHRRLIGRYRRRKLGGLGLRLALLLVAWSISALRHRLPDLRSWPMRGAASVPDGALSARYRLLTHRLRPLHIVPRPSRGVPQTTHRTSSSECAAAGQEYR